MHRLSNPADVKRFVDSIDTFFVDMDGQDGSCPSSDETPHIFSLGVLFHEGNPIPGAIETLVFLHSLGKRILFVTNNSTRSRRIYMEYFAKFGFPIAKVSGYPWPTPCMVL